MRLSVASVEMTSLWVGEIEDKNTRPRRLVGQSAAIGSHFAGGGVDAVVGVHVGFDGFVAAEASVGWADGPA